MDLVKLVKIVKKDKNVKKLISQGFFLGSCFLRNREITMHFYNPKTKKVVDIFIILKNGETSILIGEETPAINEMTKLELKEKIISPENALEKIADKGETLLTLHNKKIKNIQKIVWTINIIKTGFIVTTYEIDAENNEIIEKREDSLVKRNNISAG